MEEGPSILGPKDNGLDAIVEDGVAKLPDRTAYAGSVAIGDAMARVLRNALGITMLEIFCILSLQNAAALGIDNMKGSIEKGKDADIIVMDDNLETRMVFLNRRKINSEYPYRYIKERRRARKESCSEDHFPSQKRDR